MKLTDAGDDDGDTPTARGVAHGGVRSNGEPQILDQELYRMAAFRIRQTANRIATLAQQARDEALRSELAAVCQRLLDEERVLLELAERPR